MAATSQHTKKTLLIGTLLFLLLLAVNKGCDLFPESTFTLAGSSRLPKWVTLPPGAARQDISLTMNYYIKPWGRMAQFILRDAKGRTISRESGKMSCMGAIKIKTSSQESPTSYPGYEAITINGMTEIIEHKKMEPIFYVTDDAAIWKQYELFGCG